MAKTVEIPVEKWIADFKAWIQKISNWVVNFFQTITLYESIATGAIGVGLILLIIGLIIV
ncbi:MAG: hypothetical protein KC535_02330 [Nanoarchaeota archaeon]|nr:hypothetical protein [Nanoarchaeota archaeon]